MFVLYSLSRTVDVLTFHITIESVRTVAHDYLLNLTSHERCYFSLNTSQGNALIRSVNYLFDLFSFLIDSHLLASQFTPLLPDLQDCHLVAR